MNWTNQAEEMTQAWAEAQQNMWKQWFDLAKNGPGQPNFMFDQWQKAASDNFETWAGTASETVRDTAERMLASQKTMMEFWQFAIKAWQDISGQMETGQDWQQTLRDYTEQMRQQFTQSVEGAFKSGQDASELWQLYQDQMQKLMQPWNAWWQQSPSLFSQTLGTENVILPELGKLYTAVYEQAMLPFLQSPTLGLTREMELKMREGFTLWQAYREADYNYQMQLVDAWIKTFEQLQKVMVRLSEKGDAVTSLEELGTLFIDAAETGFGDVLASEPFFEAQGDLVNSTMRFRIYQREVMEMVMKAVDMPTRSEVDAAHKTNYLLRKDVKALKKQLAEQDDAGQAEMEETVAGLKKELSNVKRQLTVAKNSAKKNETESQKALKAMQKEIDALKKSVAAAPKAAAPAKPKRSTAKKADPAPSENQGES
jgi:class III poly(R)-hydroxyalkanoic acid synthase PhaE subunit